MLGTSPLTPYLMMAKLVAILMLIGVLCYQSSQIHKWHKQAIGLSAKLNDISTKRNEQQIVTRDRIKTVTRTIHDADDRAKVVEAAPLPGECRTPKEILEADL